MSNRSHISQEKTSERKSSENDRRRRWTLRSRIRLASAVLIAGLAAGVLYSEIALWRAQECIESRQHERSLWWLRSIEWYRPASAELHFLLARTHRRLNQESGFQTHFERARELGWPESQLQFERDVARLQSGQYQNVRTAPDRLLANAGSDLPEIGEGLAKYCLGSFRFAQMGQVLDRWQQRYPNDAGVYFFRGRLFILLSRWSDAAEQFELALKFDPNYPEARIVSAEALTALNRFEDALAILREAPESERTQAKALRLTATCLIATGETDAAEFALQELLSKEPNDPDAHLEAARLSASAGRHPRALEQIRNAHELRPEDVTIRQELARLLVRNGFEKEAQEHFEFLEKSKDSWIELDELTNRLIKEPENLELRYEVARSTWNWKSRKAGAAWFRSLLERDPRHRLAHAALADHYELAGRRDLARRHRELAGGAASELAIPERGKSSD